MNSTCEFESRGGRNKRLGSRVGGGVGRLDFKICGACRRGNEARL